MKAFVILVLLAVLLPLPVAALQSDSLRCDRGIVSLNDTMPEVIGKCGPPVFQDRRDQLRSYGDRHGRSYENVTVDEWTYNFGPQEFMYLVTFNNGRVARIESLDKGY
jgi:hypothetical protein